MGLKERLDAAKRPAEPVPATSASRPASADSAPRATLAAPLLDSLTELEFRLRGKIVDEMDLKVDTKKPEEVRRYIEEQVAAALAADQIVLGRNEREQLVDQLFADISGYGPIEPFLQDPSIDEVMVNGHGQVYIERHGRLELVPARFESDEHVMRIVDRIVAPLGRRIDEAQPYVDARLPDGSRVNVIIAPLSLKGPVLTIRKFSKIPFTVEDMVARGTFTREMVQFLDVCVKAELNVVISGGTGAGKTTLLNILSGFIPDTERIITIEDAAELQLRQKHVITLETRPPNIEGKGEVTRRDLVINALRMRPDRIIVGECRGGEALDMLQAMNTGHDGSMTTIHANNPRDSLHRVETMVLMAGFDLPLRAIREQISGAVDVIVQIARMRDGSRRVTSVTEVQGMEGEVIVTQEIFRFEYGTGKDDEEIGQLKPTGIRPKFMEKIEAAKLSLPPSVFGVDPHFRR